MLYRLYAPGWICRVFEASSHSRTHFNAIRVRGVLLMEISVHTSLTADYPEARLQIPLDVQQMVEASVINVSRNRGREIEP